MDTLTAGGLDYTIRPATIDDVAALVRLLHDDILGRRRESVDIAPYVAAFEVIDRDPAHLLACVRDQDGEVVATMQLSLIPGLARGGATRLQIEAARVAGSCRGAGLGTAMFAWAHDFGRRRGAVLVQLTSDASRGEAHLFYERLGYTPSHTGFKLTL